MSVIQLDISLFWEWLVNDYRVHRHSVQTLLYSKTQLYLGLVDPGISDLAAHGIKSEVHNDLD